MECPKCGAIVENNTLVCPNCKRVLKVICPVCRTINSSNICKKCGKVLVVRCTNCGKMNLTKDSNCSKCGCSNEYSVIKNESNSEEYALVSIEFPNSDKIRLRLGSNKLYEKFRTRFDFMIVKYLRELGFRRQIYNGNTYIIRFNKAYTFQSCAKDAIDTVIELINMFSRLNVKLLNRMQIALKCNISIFKRTVDDDNENLKDGFRANMLSYGKDIESKTLNQIQVITDEQFYDIYSNDYKMEGLDFALVNDEMKKFYEIDLTPFIKIDEYIDEEIIEEDDEEIPEFIQNSIEDDSENLEKDSGSLEQEIYYKELQSFDNANCTFHTCPNIKILSAVSNILKNVPKGILAINGRDIYQPYTIKLLSIVDELDIYKNVIPITCYDEMKYYPYAFFRELISSVFEYCTSQKLLDSNNYSVFDNINAADIIEDLIKLNKKEVDDINEKRQKYLDAFLQLFQAIPNTLIYIENFEKIDDSSAFILSQLFEHISDLDVSYLITYDKNYALHKKFPFLLSFSEYTEITLIPSKFKSIVAEDVSFYQNVLDDFYFQKVAKYTKGSLLFLDLVINYLIDSGVYRIKNGTLCLRNRKTIIIPAGIEQIIKHRLLLLKKDKKAFKFFIMCLLIGPRIDFKTAELFGFNDWQKILDKLASDSYVYLYNDCIYFSNYNILKRGLLNTIVPAELREIVSELLIKIYDEDYPNPTKAELYEYVNQQQKIIAEWEKLANVNLSVGDSYAYLNCTEKILNYLDKYSKDWPQNELETYQVSIYENIAGNMIEYNPHNSGYIAKRALSGLEKYGKTEKFVELCLKMIEGAVHNGDFPEALSLTHRILSVINHLSINPSAQNFGLSRLVIAILHLKIMFNMGRFEDCLSLGYNIINVLDSSKIDSINFSIIDKNEFINLFLECLCYIAISNIVLLHGNIEEYLNILNSLFDFIPPDFNIFIQLQKTIRAEDIDIPEKAEFHNLICALIYHIVKGIKYLNSTPEFFASEMYQVKVNAKYSNLKCFEYFADLMINYAKINSENTQGVAEYISRLIENAKENGMFDIVQIGMYIMSCVNIKIKNYNSAYEILNNLTIQFEQNPFSDYFVLLTKINLYIVLNCMQKKSEAQICMNHAQYIVNKYGLNFDLNIDITQFLSENHSEVSEQESVTNIEDFLTEDQQN